LVRRVLHCLLPAASCLLISAATAAAQGGQMPPMPKPGPEHALLKADVGTWDAVVEVSMPGAPAQKSKGVEVNKMGCGGLCLITDFTSEMMGTPFQGHGVTTWDPKKQKYVGSWTDSMSTGMSIGESTYDATSKKLEGTMEGPDATGNIMKARTLVEYRDANTRVFTVYAAGPDGKEAEMMKITYTRRGAKPKA
jgi:hypothetical protein